MKVVLFLLLFLVAVAGIWHISCGFDRLSGWPTSLKDLEGEWVLDYAKGSFDTAPPQRLRFGPATKAEHIALSAGGQELEFELQGAGLFVFPEGTSLRPLVPGGASEVYTMTHLCPPLPPWDHLKFFPDGMPVGSDPTRRVINYERE
jgi:hypothetical protein